MPDISGMITIYIYLLFGSLLLVVVLAVARAVGGDVFHHDVTIDHTAEIGGPGEAHAGIGGHGPGGPGMMGTGELGETATEPTDQPGLVKFQGMTLMTISIFLVSFAAMGILTLYFLVGPYNLDPLTSLPVAGVASAALALGLSYGAFKYFIESAASSEISLREVVGRPCEVTTGTSGDNLGEVSCNVKGQIMSFSARSVDGSRINVGDSALIMRMTGNIAVIQRRQNQ